MPRKADNRSIVGAWHDEMALFIRAQDPYAHLITTSSEVGQPIWNQTDYYQHHDYPSDYITALADPIRVPNGQPVRPILAREAGRDTTTFYGQHAPVWAGIMGNQSGAAQPLVLGSDGLATGLQFDARGERFRRAPASRNRMLW